MAQKHVDALEALALDPEVRRHTPALYGPPAGFASPWVDGYERGRAEGTREAFAITAAADGSFLGIAAAVRVDEVTSEAELVCILTAEARGCGVATEALALLTEWGFARGLHRLELRICADDAVAQRVGERCGYAREGLLRSAHFSAEGGRDPLTGFTEAPPARSHSPLPGGHRAEKPHDEEIRPNGDGQQPYLGRR